MPAGRVGPDCREKRVIFGGIGVNLGRIQDHSLAKQRVIRGLQRLDLEKKGVYSSYTSLPLVVVRLTGQLINLQM